MSYYHNEYVYGIMADEHLQNARREIKKYRLIKKLRSKTSKEDQQKSARKTPSLAKPKRIVETG